jgi:hypothetical protein
MPESSTNKLTRKKGVAVAASIFVVYAMSDWMPFGRFMVPAAPLMAACVATLMADASRRSARGWSRRRIAIAVLSLSLATLGLLLAGIQTPPPVAFVEGTVGIAALSGSFAVALHILAAALALAARYGVELPIAAQVGQLLAGRKDARTALEELMLRPQRAEAG